MEAARSRMLATIAAAGMVAASVVASTPSQAHHDHKGALVGGLIAGAVLGAAMTAGQPPPRPQYHYGRPPPPAYYPPQPSYRPPPAYYPPYTPARAVDLEAGPIWDQRDAQGKCPNICRRSGGMTWDGNWRTTVAGQMSVCSCRP